MRKTNRKVGWSMKLSGLLLVLGATGAANAETIDLGTVVGEPGSTFSRSFTEFRLPGDSFIDFVTFSLTAPSYVDASIESAEASVFSLDLLGIEDFSATLQRLGPGGFETVATGVPSSPISFEELLSPGDYGIALSGISSGVIGGLYSGDLQVAVVPEAEVWVMLLVGFGIVLYQLGRKQRLLERQPVAA